MGYTYLWEFDVPAENQAAFERMYGPDGDWIGLFRKASGYLGSTLLRDRANPSRYITIDRWRDEAAYRNFHSVHREAYASLDLRCEGLASRETSLGAYDDAFV